MTGGLRNRASRAKTRHADVLRAIANEHTAMSSAAAQEQRKSDAGHHGRQKESPKQESLDSASTNRRRLISDAKAETVKETSSLKKTKKQRSKQASPAKGKTTKVVEKPQEAAYNVRKYQDSKREEEVVNDNNFGDREQPADSGEQNGDLMRKYYGMSAARAARELFGADLSGVGVIYAETEDYVPHKMEFFGKTARGTNMRTGKPSGLDGFEGVVISEERATILARVVLNRVHSREAA